MVIFIMSLVAGIVIINTDFLLQYKERNELKTVVLELNVARNSALLTGEKNSVNFNFGENSYKNKDGENKKLKYLKLSKNKSNIRKFEFTKSGSTSSKGSGTIVLLGRENEYRISVEPIIGNVNVYENE